MKATLTFRLPKEHSEHVAALRGGEAISLLAEIDRYCRNILKHGSLDNETTAALSAIRELIPKGLIDG